MDKRYRVKVPDELISLPHGPPEGGIARDPTIRRNVVAPAHVFKALRARGINYSQAFRRGAYEYITELEDLEKLQARARRREEGSPA